MSFDRICFQHLVQLVHARLVHVARSAARFEQEQRIGVERGDLEIVRVLRGHDFHPIGVRPILIDAFLRVEFLDVANRHRVDERLFLGVGVALQADGFLDGFVGVRRFFGTHRRVEIRPPRPRLAPVADRAVGIAFPRLAKRPHRLGLRERIHHLEALIEERLGLLVRGRHRLGERAEPVLVNLDRLGVAVVERPRRRGRPAPARQGAAPSAASDATARLRETRTR